MYVLDSYLIFILEKVLEQFMMEKLYDSLSTELRIWLKEKRPATAVELGRLANEHVQAKKGPLVDGKYVGYTEVVRSRQKPPSKSDSTESTTTTTSTSLEKKPEEKTTSNSAQLKSVKCFNCQAYGHYASRCPLPDKRTEVKKSESAAYLCVTPLERDSVYVPSYISGEIEGGMAEMLADSGCTRTLVNRRFVHPSKETGHAITVLTANGEKVEAKVQIKSKSGTHTELVGVLENLPVDCLLGKSSYRKTLRKEDILQHWEDVTGLTSKDRTLIDNESLQVQDDQAFVVTRRQELLRAAQEREDKLVDRESIVVYKNLAPAQTKPVKIHESDIDISPLFSEATELSRDKLDSDVAADVDNTDTGIATDGMIKQRNILDRNRTQVIQDQRDDSNLRSIKTDFNQAPTDHDGYYRDNGLLMHRKFKNVEYNGVKYFDRIVVPQAYRPEILRIAHTIPIAGHMGQEKTRERIEPHFHWPGCLKEINDYCATCPECQIVARKMKALRAPLLSLPIVSEPFRKVAIDLIGELPRSKNGYKYILTLVDYATRYPEAVPLRNTSSRHIADALINIFCRVGIPEELVSDQGSNLIGELMKQLYESLGITKINVSTYHPEANGLVERFNGTLKTLLRKFVDDNVRDWDKYIPFILFAYREVPSSSTGYSPFELLYGRMIRGPLSVIKDNWMSKNTGEQNLLSYIL